MLPELSKKYQYGFYRVGAEIITHKASALVRAKQLGVSVTWHFHNEVYSKLNWEQDFPISLNFIYQARARQLREKYEYLVLSFSGGSDSWTILKAFVDSNTHLDEVFVRWPVNATYKKYNIGINNKENIVFEWELTILPMLNKYKDLLPHTKFTIHDWSDSILTTELTDDDWLTVNDYMNPGVFFKINAMGDGELDAMIAGKKTAHIYGADKPQIWYKNDKVYCYFLDKFAHGRAGSRHGNSQHLTSVNRTSELFYWTPDFPELVLAQSREIFRYLQSNPVALQLIDQSIPYSRERKNSWDILVRDIIYNDYTKLNTFQAKKPTSSVMNENDAFLFEVPNLKLLQSWEYGLKNVFASVDEQYIQKRNGVADGFTGFIDGMYCLGTISPEVNL